MPKTIYIPIYLFGRNSSAHLELNYALDEMSAAELRANLNQSARLGYPPTITHEEMTSPNIHSIIAERINCYMEFCTNCYPNRPPIFQVGMSEGEAFGIINQHSWYKRFSGYGTAKVTIPDDKLRPQQSEADYYGPGLLSARGGLYYSLQAGTTINAAAITAWIPGEIRRPYQRAINPAPILAANPPAILQAPNQPLLRNFGFFLRMLLGQQENIAPAPAPVARAPAVAAGVANPVARAAEPSMQVANNARIEPILADVPMPGNLPIVSQVKKYDGILDPVLFTPITDPVTTPDGFTYERICILQCLERKHEDPLNRAPLTEDKLRTNRTLKSLIDKAFDPTAPSRALPQEFIDPFSKQLIEEAVLAEDGYCYDKKSLLAQCQANGHVVSPRDGKTLIGKSLIVDRTFMSLLDEYHGSRDENIETLLHCFPNTMTEEQLLEHIRHYSTAIDIESSAGGSPTSKLRNFYLAERLLAILEAKYDERERASALQQPFDREANTKAKEGKIVTCLRLGLLNYQNSLYQGQNKKNKIDYAARALLSLDKALQELTALPYIYSAREIYPLIKSLYKVCKEVLNSLATKKPYTGNNPRERNPEQHYPAELDLVDIGAFRQKINLLEELFVSPESMPEKILETFCATNRSKTIVMFDYDGTLVTLETPKKPITDKAELKRTLSVLAANPNVIVVIASKHGQERKSLDAKQAVDLSIEEFLIKELEIDPTLVSKIHIHGMESLNRYQKELDGQPKSQARDIPFKVAVATKIYRDSPGIGKFVYVNDSMAELEEMQQVFKDVVAVPVLLDSAKNRLINKECFSHLTSINNCSIPVNNVIVEQQLRLKDAWQAGYDIEYAATLQMPEGPQKQSYCIGSGYFNMTIEALRTFIEYENKFNDKSASCIMFATKMMFELAQVHAQELNATAIRGYLNFQLTHLSSPQYPDGYRLANWLVVLVNQIKLGAYEREAVANLAQIRQQAEQRVNSSLQKRKEMAAQLVMKLGQLFPGFTCQHQGRLDQYAREDNYLAHPENVFKVDQFSVDDGSLWVGNLFKTLAKNIVSSTDPKSNNSQPAELNTSGMFNQVFDDLYKHWLPIRAKLEDAQRNSWTGKQANPIWVKPVNPNIDNWTQSIAQYLRALTGQKIAKDHPAITLMNICQQLFTLPIFTIDTANIEPFIAELQNRIKTIPRESAPVAIQIPRK